MLDLSLQINNCGFTLAQPVNWAKFNRSIESHNKIGLGPKVKIRKLGWFGKWQEGAAQEEDELYKVSGCNIGFFGGSFGLVPIDASSPFGSCSTAACLYAQRNILRKINIFATSPSVPMHGLPSRAETLMVEFHSQCSAIFGEPSVPLMPAGGQPVEEALAWSDSESIVKISTFYRKIFVVMWEVLQPAWNAKALQTRKTF